MKPEKNIYFIFQPAEETGEGARECLSLFKKEKIDQIYGFHNIPGYPLGQVLLRASTFACASTGLEITMEGAPSHAAYPEDGRNPAYLMADTVLFMKNWMKDSDNHQGIILGTVIGMDLGSDAYGMSASSGVLRLTIRGEIQQEFDRFLEAISDYVTKRGEREGIVISIKEVERFPATMNTPSVVKYIEETALLSGLKVSYLDEPMRWSEDFGYYLQKVEGAFFGVGAGVDHPKLHTRDYEFPDEMISAVIELYIDLL